MEHRCYKKKAVFFFCFTCLHEWWAKFVHFPWWAKVHQFPPVKFAVLTHCAGHKEEVCIASPP